MKAVFIIVDYSLSTKLETVLKKENVHFKLVTHGFGSADSTLLEFLGLGENKKAVFISLLKREKIKPLYKMLEKEMNLSRAGSGIAFTVPVTSISAAITKMFPDGILNALTTSTEEKVMPEEAKFELIITIVNRGYFDIVKNAAKSAGARGGTMIHGLGIGGEEAAKFMGINIQPEKDIILIVVNREDKQSVLQKIVEQAGILTESRGVCFTLPVDSAHGLAEKNDDSD